MDRQGGGGRHEKAGPPSKGHGPTTRHHPLPTTGHQSLATSHRSLLPSIFLGSLGKEGTGGERKDMENKGERERW